MAAQLWTTGPCHVYVGSLTGGTAAAFYLGTCEEKPQVEKRFYDAACQTKEDRQGEQAQDESRTRFPDTCDVIAREPGHESLRPAVRESLFHCGLCHGPIRGSLRRSRHLDRVRR